ncbi:MAG: alpha/beta fold hydrolase [Planctomycetaceae bacterium]|nr:alpha/beta fold hydrolase [Planctomycetales bacterium]MCB9924653.1 alpha/beta fold hydrolase [Planctomycetaceae bacterium]
MHRTLPLSAILFFMMLPALTPAEEETDPRRPAAIATEEVPVVPEELFERLNQYTNIRSADMQGWSPDGNGILVSTRFGNSSQLHRVYTPGGRREQVTFFEEPVRGGFIPQAKDGSMLLSMSVGGNENYQVYLLDRGSFTSTLLTDGVSRNSLGAIRDDGQQVVISSNRRNGRDTDLYIADPRKPDSMEIVFQTDGEYWYAADWSNDASTLLLGRYVSINESYFALLDVKTRKRTDLTLPDGITAAIGNLRFSADSKSIYITTDAHGEYNRLARYDIAAKEYHWLTESINWDVSELEVHPESGQVAFAVNEDGASRLYLLDGDTPRPLELPLGILSNIEFSPDGKQLGFTLSRPDAPSDAYSLSLDDEHLTRWTFSEVGGLDPDKFVTPQRIQFQSFDERTIPAYYYKPRGASADSKAPVVISIHGGPESQYQPYFSSSSQYYVNDLDFAVIAPNVRGSAGYGKTYLKLDNGALREDSVKDIGALLDWIAAQPELDASEVAVVGGSYGGYMVLASLIHYGDRIKAGIDIVGIASFTTFLENTAAYRQDLRRAEYGDERDPKMREVFDRINPTSNADKIRSALMVAHGVNDPRVPFSEAQQIADKVRSQKRSVWTVYADNEGHGFGKKDNADYVRAVQVMFLKQHLRP